MAAEARAGAWGSALSAQEFAAVRSVGCEPVGQVLGTAVLHIGYVDNFCSYMWSSNLDTAVSSRARAPYSTLVWTMAEARRTALARAAADCHALGGDGIVGVRLRTGPFPGGGTEFTVLGTAVRTHTRFRPERPFTSHLNGQDFAKLVHGGFFPVGLVLGISIATRHDDYTTRVQAGRFSGSREVTGYTDLVTAARRDARAQLVKDAASTGGEGAVLDTAELRTRAEPCGNGNVDHVAEAVLLGTSVVRIGRTAQNAGPRPLTIMRLERER